MRHFHSLWKSFSKSSSKFLSDSRGYSYCKKNYSKDEVNAVKITQVRLEEMKKNV